MKAPHRERSKTNNNESITTIRKNMHRTGHLYEQTAIWENLVEAETTCCKRRMSNHGVKRHIKRRWHNMVEIQRRILDRSIHTGEYKHEQRVSGQDKLRDIAKLKFHPSHIWHKVLVDVGARRVEKALIDNTFASRVGYGQTRAALRIRDYLRKHKDEVLWYAQGDFVKYYDNIHHEHIRRQMERLYKDKEYIDAFIEPFTKFSPNGKSIPLGINPSQTAGNLVRMPFDRFATETVKCKGYTSYLDDFVFFGKTKGEVKAKMKRLVKFAKEYGYELHAPKIRRVSEGLSTMGYVFYEGGNMYWRRSDKRRWLKRRSKVTNPRRLREIDSAAWGMLKWGNNDCRLLFRIKTGRKYKYSNNKYKIDMGIQLSKSGIKRTERTDADGRPFIDKPKISMSMVLERPVEVIRWIKGIKTSQGANRYGLEIAFMGDTYKLIVNSCDIKTLIDDMEAANITRFGTIFYDKGGLHYSYREDKTEILEVGRRRIEERGGMAVYVDNGEKVTFNNN